MSERQRFTLHLPGLLKVLAEHLYSSKKVGVRELIQNAHDSCVRRKIERNEPGYRPRIDVALDAPRRLVVITDNGNGLTEEEIGTYLSTIGRDYTRELRERGALFAGRGGRADRPVRTRLPQRLPAGLRGRADDALRPGRPRPAPALDRR